MAIRNFLKKVGDKAKLIALVGGIGLAGASGCRSPEGTEVKRPADGIVDASERKARVEAAADIVTPVHDDNEVLLGLLNDDEVAMSKRMKERGMEWKGLGGLYLHTSENIDELNDRYEYCTFGGKMPDEFSAFYCPENDTAYLIEAPLAFLVNTFEHEFGHHVNGDFDAQGHIVEIPSEAMRIYSSIFRRSQDMATGTMLGRFTFSDSIPQDVPIDSADDISRYQIGVMSFFMEANNQCGDLDRALDSILHADGDKLQHIIDDGLARNAGFSAREIWFNEIDDLLNDQGFLHYLESLGMQTGEKRTEAEELRDYFKIMAKDSMIYSKNVFAQDSSKETQERQWMFEDYMDSGTNSQFFNPHFKNRIVNELTKHYITEVLELAQESTHESWADVAALAEKIIRMNEGYPCEHDAFACSSTVSKYRPEHVDAYFYKITGHYMNDEKDEALAAADQFLGTFYPNGNYAYAQNDQTLAPRLIKVLERAYTYSDIFASCAKSMGDEANYGKYKCRALDYLRLLNEATCYHVEDEALKEKCYNDSGIRNSENGYLVKLPQLEEEMQGVCQ